MFDIPITEDHYDALYDFLVNGDWSPFTDPEKKKTFEIDAALTKDGRDAWYKYIVLLSYLFHCARQQE